MNIGLASFSRCSNLLSIVVSEGNLVYDSRDNCNAIIKTASGELILGCSNTVIPDGVTSIEERAFEGSSALNSISFPNSVTHIDIFAFSGCTALSSVIIPNHMTYIGFGVFAGCPNIVSIVVSEDNPVYDSRDNCNAIIESSSNSLILGCSNTVVPDDVINLCTYAFSGCLGLTTIDIPDGVACIGSDAFEGCSNLLSITIPDGIKIVDYMAFYRCSNLSSVTSLATIAPKLGQMAFSSISPDAVLYIPSGSEADYEAKGWYEYFSRVATIGSEEHISDGTLDEYVNESERGPIDIHYTRTLPNLAWNPLYVPFEIPCSALSGKYDVAYINSLHSYDYDDDGTIDNMTVEVVKIPSGTLKANYPYLIRARSDADRSMHLVLEDATLYRTEENGIDCSSVYNLFEVKGTYSRKSSAELGGSLAISTSGAWQPIPEGSSLGPFRLYLTISSRGDSPLKIEPSALSRVNIVVSGEDDSATGIDGVEQGSASQANSTKIYDLSGRRVHSPSRGGVYMVNGRKVVL